MAPKIRLTPEERKELKKKKQQEKKLKRAEKKRQIKRDYLGREIRYGELTYKKYEKTWKEMLTKVALPRMRQELEFAWHNFERIMDCKDFEISVLMDDIRDSEEQYMRNFRRHSENIDKLINMLNERLKELQEDYENDVKEMQTRCEMEFQDMKEVNDENSNYLKTMLYRLEMERKEHMRLKRGEYISRLDEVDVKNQLMLQKMKANTEKRYYTMFTAMKNFVKSYNKQIKERRKEHNLLKEQDDAVQELIARQLKHMKKLQDTVRQLRQKNADMKQTDGSRLSDLQVERQYFSNSFLSLKSKLEADKKDDFDKLAQLSTSCSQVQDRLLELNKRGEKLLILGAVCRKLETKKEKILPFPVTTISTGDDKVRDDVEEIEGVQPELELFWQRLGQAYGVHYALSREKKFLCQENELIVQTHNEYCEKLVYPPIINYHNRVSIPSTTLTNANIREPEPTVVRISRRHIHYNHK